MPGLVKGAVVHDVTLSQAHSARRPSALRLRKHWRHAVDGKVVVGRPRAVDSQSTPPSSMLACTGVAHKARAALSAYCNSGLSRQWAAPSGTAHGAMEPAAAARRCRIRLVTPYCTRIAGSDHRVECGTSGPSLGHPIFFQPYVTQMYYLSTNDSCNVQRAWTSDEDATWRVRQG